VREAVEVRGDIAAWWALARDGAEAAVDAEDEVFVAQALAMLPPQPWTVETWGQWTEAVKAATGRKGRELYRPLRRAMTGRETGPEMAALMPLLRPPARR
jgi:glutamyl-tRNA synthetase